MKRKLSTVVLTGCLATLLVGCDNFPSESIRKQEESKARTIDSLINNQPITQLGFSMDRYLLDQRNVRFNDPNKLNYLYVFTPNGYVLSVTIVGKLASTSKRLTATDYMDHSGHGNNTVVRQSPDEVGTYGSSVGDKIGLTTLGSMIEFGGFVGHIYSEVPLNFKNIPTVEVTVEATPQEREALAKQLKDVRGKSK